MQLFVRQIVQRWWCWRRVRVEEQKLDKYAVWGQTRRLIDTGRSAGWGHRAVGLWELGVAVYVLITAVALVLTWREQLRTKRRSPLMNAVGLLACTIWPLVLAVFLVVMRKRAT